MPVTQTDLDAAVRVASAFGARRLILFGSAQRDPAHAQDLDLAVGGVPGWAIWKLAARLERAVSVPLDVVPLEPETALTRRIEAEGEVLFER